ncbi:MAG: DUF4234 domain-containing protein [Candidatus Dormibacteraeota bacterium]|nr:DUF4234 domain-containing protein [Candidatus Dormibacteraeota bacterium]
MAETLIIGGTTFKMRNVFAVWLGLPLITLGIYSYVWIYKVNDEARRYLRDDSINPGMSVLAFFPGAILVVPPLIAIYRLGTRIARMEEAAGVQSRVEPVIGLLLAFVFSSYSLYYQSHLNAIWARYPQAGPAAVPPPIAPPSAPQNTLLPPQAVPPPMPS